MLGTPCDHSHPCATCAAREVLDAKDWVLIRFSDQVADQYINQTTMGQPHLTPRLEGYEAALRIYGYHRDDWPELVKWALFLHTLRYKTESPNDMVRRFSRSDEYPQGKTLAQLTLEDCTDGSHS